MLFFCVEGDVLDDTAISEELLDDNDDVLNVSETFCFQH